MGIRRGFTDPVLDSQRVFRALLDAMAHPGRVVAVPGPEDPPLPLGSAAAATALALLDFETPVWLDAAAATPEIAGYLRFHCGAPLVEEPRAAQFALIVHPTAMPPLEAFDAGSDERPERSATLVLQVDGLAAGRGRRLTGPGIHGTTWLDVPGAAPRFWDAVRANAACFPRGVDLLLCAGALVAALPRSTRVEA
jgi:alpha-D-ribose 1-methylphosphonate 5-triphosphate synthase subunit PhnH